MIDCSAIDDRFEEEPDPRISGQHVRCIDGGGGRGTVVLVGVVHDHPASEFRTQRLLEWIEPDFLVLELPPLAVPLFELYADDPESPPQLGGEMSTAIQGTAAPVVGIDAPNTAYLHRLVAQGFGGTIEPREFIAVARDFVRSSVHAVGTRIGASFSAAAGVRPILYEPIRYDDCSPFDTPAHQATHESNHIAKRESFVNAVELPREIVLIDRLREATMIDRIAELRRQGDLVVVIGMEHLEKIAAGLAEHEASARGDRPD